MLSYSSYNPSPYAQGWHRPQWLGSSTSTSNEENALVDTPTEKSDGGNSVIEVPPSRVKLTHSIDGPRKLNEESTIL